MTVFSVCSNFVEKSGKDPKYLLNVLYPFVQDTPLRIALDGGSGKILEYYTEAIRNSGSSQLKMWLRYLLKNPSDNLEYINVKCVNVGKYETFVEVASRVVSEPHLIAWSLQDYKDVGAADKGVEIIERGKSIRRIRKVTRAIDETAGEMTAAVGAKNPKEGKIMINIFSGIQGSTIVSDSLVQGSFNHVKETYNADTAQALLKIAEFVNKSKYKGAGELLDSFNKELVKPDASKPVLKSLWDGLVRILPDIVTLSDAVKRITSLFT
jgi:hypothetical protein